MWWCPVWCKGTKSVEITVEAQGSFVKHEDSPCEVSYIFHYMTAHEDCAGQRCQEFNHGTALARVEPGTRLVEQ